MSPVDIESTLDFNDRFPELIMTEKYIGMFTQAEGFNDWRRTGIPALTPTSGAQIPRRYHYSSGEYLFNENAPDETAVTLFAPRVGWDTP